MKASAAAPVFAALGDETRLAIVGSLCRSGPQSTSRLTGDARVSRQAVSKHLEALSRAGIVRGTRAGRERMWSVRTQRLAEVKRWVDQISRDWDEAIERLRVLVERE